MPFTDLNMHYHSPPIPNNDTRCAFWEIFTQPRVAPVVRRRGGRSKRSVDIEMGKFWDLTSPDVQHCLLSDVCLLRPFFVMMSPPCTMVCQLVFSNWFRMDPVERNARLREALLFFDVCAWIASFQQVSGGYYCIENPEGSQAWKREAAPQLKHQLWCKSCSAGFSLFLRLCSSMAQP